VKRAPTGEWELIELAAADLRADNRAFTGRNLFHAVRRAATRRGRPFALDFESFRSGPLAARRRTGPLPGLLPELEDTDRGSRLPREWDAYFPACILVVDRAELVPLFAASGVVVQARMAIVALDGRPAPVVSWLRRGFRAGHRAPLGYLHDAATVVYPFDREPLATWARSPAARDAAAFRDLGLPPQGAPADRFGDPLGDPSGDRGAPVLELEAPSPHAVIAYAARCLLAMIPPDPMLFPLTSRRPRRRSGRSEVAHD
jgi:hypothetical protein